MICDNSAHTCCCSHEWCRQGNIRGDHLLGNSRIRINLNVDNRVEWLRCLGFCTTDEVEKFNTILDPRVWVGHFFPEDWVLKIGNDGKICFDTIQKSDMTRRKFARDSSFKNMPPLPLASKCDITDVALNFFSLRYNDNHTLDNFMKTYRKNKLLPLAKYFELDHPAKEMAASMSHPTYHYKRLPGGRLGEKKPFHESYIGTADQLILLAKEMEEHAKKCAGEIVILRQGVKNSGLTLCVKGKCSLGLQCECIGEGKSRFIHAGGVFYWQSAASITIASATTSKQVSTPDVLLAVASQTTRGGLLEWC